MDNTTVSKYFHQLDAYFDLVDLKDDTKRGQIAVGLLEGQAHTWYQVQGNVWGWGNLRAASFGYFKPVDNAFKARQALAYWTQKGSVTEYIVGFWSDIPSALT